MCVCVCERERERGREGVREGERERERERDSQQPELDSSEPDEVASVLVLAVTVGVNSACDNLRPITSLIPHDLNREPTSMPAQSRRDQEEGGELDSHEEASPEEIESREVELG